MIMTVDLSTLPGIETFMADLRSAYEDLVGGISPTARQRIRDAVATYSADLLPRINQRLLQCDDLLRRGLRDEALGHAAEEPRLTIAANLLDLRRFGQDFRDWMEASRKAGILEPDPPRMDVVKNLVEAEQQVTALEPLLARWRRSNIARAPLAERIAILRELRAADGTSPVWPEALKSHEDYRLMQIKAVLSRLKEARLRSDADIAAAEGELAACIADLRSAWTALQPPAGLAESAASMLAGLRDRRIDSQLDRLVEELERAHAAVEADRSVANKDRLKKVCGDWHAALGEKGAVSPDDPRLVRAKPATQYVDLLVTYETRLAEVSQSLTERPTRFRAGVAWSESLDRMMNELEDAVTRLPAADVDGRAVVALSDRVADAVAAVEREKRGRLVRFVASFAAALAVVGGAAYTTVTVLRHDRLVTEAVAEVGRLRERVATGEEFVVPEPEQLYTPALRADPRLANALGLMSNEASKQDERRAQLASRLDQVKKLLDVIHASQRLDPLAPWPPEFAEASRLIESISGDALVLTEAEKARLDHAATSLRDVANALTDVGDDAVLVAVKKVEAELVGAEASLRDSPERTDAVLAAAGEEIGRLRKFCETAASPGAATPYADTKLASSLSKRQLDAESKLLARINALRAKRDTLMGLGAREARADGFLMAASYGAYADILREMSRSLDGDDPVARDYQQVADDVASWEAVAEWNDLATRIGDVAGITARTAGSVLEKIDSVSPDVRRLSCARDVLGRLPGVLKECRELTPDKVAAIRGVLEKIFRSQYGTQLDGVIFRPQETGTDAGKQFYCLRKDRPVGNEPPKNVKYVTGWPDTKGNWPTKTHKFEAPGDDGEVRDVLLDSAQKRLALACLAIVEAFPTEDALRGDVDRRLVAVLKTCAEGPEPVRRAGQPSLDPCLHAILLRYVLLETSKANGTIRSELAGPLQKLNAGKGKDGQDIQIKGVDNEMLTAALDPEKQHADLVIQDAREACRQFIADVAQGATRAEKRLHDEEAKLASMGLARFQLCGRLRRLQDGGWSISGGDAANRCGRAIFVPQRSGIEINLNQVAVCDERGHIAAGTKVSARAGDPVYLQVMPAADTAREK